MAHHTRDNTPSAVLAVCLLESCSALAGMLLSASPLPHVQDGVPSGHCQWLKDACMLDSCCCCCCWWSLSVRYIPSDAAAIAHQNHTSLSGCSLYLSTYTRGGALSGCIVQWSSTQCMIGQNIGHVESSIGHVLQSPGHARIPTSMQQLLCCWCLWQRCCLSQIPFATLLPLERQSRQTLVQIHLHSLCSTTPCAASHPQSAMELCQHCCTMHCCRIAHKGSHRSGYIYCTATLVVAYTKNPHKALPSVWFCRAALFHDPARLELHKGFGASWKDWRCHFTSKAMSDKVFADVAELCGSQLLISVDFKQCLCSRHILKDIENHNALPLDGPCARQRCCHNSNRPTDIIQRLSTVKSVDDPQLPCCHGSFWSATNSGVCPTTCNSVTCRC